MSDEQGGDEDLPTPPERSAQQHRLVIAAAVLIPVMLIIAAVLRFTGGSSGNADPAVTVTATAAPPSPTSSSELTLTLNPTTGAVSGSLDELAVLHRLTPGELADAHAECPRLAATCTTTGEIPTDVIEAIRASFPTASHLVSVSDIAYDAASGPRLAFRRVSARAGPLAVAIRVRQATGRDQQRSTTARETVRAQIVSDGLAVELQVSGTSIPSEDVTDIERLVADPRLLAVG